MGNNKKLHSAGNKTTTKKRTCERMLGGWVGENTNKLTCIFTASEGILGVWVRTVLHKLCSGSRKTVVRVFVRLKNINYCDYILRISQLDGPSIQDLNFLVDGIFQPHKIEHEMF